MQLFKMAALTALVTAYMSSSAETLTVGLDLSLSNPLVKDSAFSQTAAQYVAHHIKGMKDGDKIRIKTFGSRDNAANFNTKEKTISRHGSAKMARAVAQYIQHVVKDNSNTQKSTNIVAWLEFNDFDCANNGKIIALTDGIEASSYVDPNALLDGKKDLPAPDEYAKLKGCDVVFYGLGIGWQPQQVKTLRKQWSRYFKQAGSTFSVIIP